LKTISDKGKLNVITIENQRNIFDKKHRSFHFLSKNNESTIKQNDLPAIKSVFENASENTFMIKVKGSSMINAGIEDGDTLVVKKTEQIENGNIVIAEINGKLAVKRVHSSNGQLTLHSENKNFAPIKILKDDMFRIRGIVSMVIKST
jgi:SOS-response transcriptional repressor LexA